MPEKKFNIIDIYLMYEFYFQKYALEEGAGQVWRLELSDFKLFVFI